MTRSSRVTHSETKSREHSMNASFPIAIRVFHNLHRNAVYFVFSKQNGDRWFQSDDIVGNECVGSRRLLCRARSDSGPDGRGRSAAQGLHGFAAGGRHQDGQTHHLVSTNWETTRHESCIALVEYLITLPPGEE